MGLKLSTFFFIVLIWEFMEQINHYQSFFSKYRLIFIKARLMEISKKIKILSSFKYFFISKNESD